MNERALEAAAKVRYELRYSDLSWEDATEDERKMHLRFMRKAIEAYKAAELLPLAEIPTKPGGKVTLRQATDPDITVTFFEEDDKGPGGWWDEDGNEWDLSEGSLDSEYFEGIVSMEVPEDVDD